MRQLTPHDVLVILPIGIFGIISWSIWLYRRTMSHLAKPTINAFTTTSSLVVPVYGEDPVVLSQCLDTWIAAGPTEIILVLDVNDHECLNMLASREKPDWVRVLVFAHRGKRSALGVGIRAATSEIVIMADSDTAWSPDLLRNVLMPFASGRVGGVGTRQVVAARDTSIWRRVASWLLDTRFLDYVPAMGAKGAVPCVSGRTAAYRRAVVTPLLPYLEHEVYLGRECIAGDDGRLTWLVLGTGHLTVHQGTAVAVSMFPDTFRAFVKQRIRWSRNSYRCYTTAMWKGWLWHQPFITQLTVIQNVLTPVTMGVSLLYLWFAVGRASATLAALLVAWVFVGRAIRGLSHLREHPRDLLIVPIVVPVVILIALPIKLYAFITMNRQGWLTRDANSVGGEGQASGSLADKSVLS